jgi:hypothetical protein
MNKYNKNMIICACELMSVLMHHAPRDKCGSVGSSSQPTHRQRIFWRTMECRHCFQCWLLLALNKDKGAYSKKMVGPALGANTANGGGITASKYN